MSRHRLDQNTVRLINLLSKPNPPSTVHETLQVEVQRGLRFRVRQNSRTIVILLRMNRTDLSTITSTIHSLVYNNKDPDSKMVVELYVKDSLMFHGL